MCGIQCIDTKSFMTNDNIEVYFEDRCDAFAKCFGTGSAKLRAFCKGTMGCNWSLEEKRGYRV